MFKNHQTWIPWLNKSCKWYKTQIREAVEPYSSSFSCHIPWNRKNIASNIAWKPTQEVSCLPGTGGRVLETMSPIWTTLEPHWNHGFFAWTMAWQTLPNNHHMQSLLKHHTLLSSLHSPDSLLATCECWVLLNTQVRWGKGDDFTFLLVPSK